MFTYIQRQVEGAFSGERAKTLTAAIHSSDRWSTFSQYRLCGNYCATCMREYGLDAVELMEIPADGETKFGDWTMPLAWDVEEAHLELLEPRAAARLLASYREEPASLAMWSAPTPPEGLEAEVVLVEGGSEEGDYGGVDVKGKLVFTSLHANKVRGPAVRHGAVGVISDYPGREQDELAESVCWVNAWVDYHGWGFLKGDTRAFGFSLTREKGEYLRRLLAAGRRVRVRALVRSWLYQGSFPLATGVIPGEGETEVLVYAHSYEYGAEDNAAGCAVALEAARTLNRLIRDGRLPSPRRSIRFMMSWECYGSMAWGVQRIHHDKNVVAGLCLDDVGGKKELTGGRVRLILDSDCQASFADFAASAIARSCFREEEGFPCEISPWSGGTDHTIFQDPMFAVPMPWLTEHPARFHHTSLDKMDKIDVESLRKEGVFAATYLYFLANAGEEEIAWLARGTRTLWEDRIAEAKTELVEALVTSSSLEELGIACQRGKERIEYLAERGRDAILSIERLCGEEESRAVLKEEVERLRRQKDHILEELEREARRRTRTKDWVLSAPEGPLQRRDGADLVPRRLVPGPVTLCAIGPEERSEYDRVTRGESPMWSPTLTFALYWADGRRSLAEIRRLVELELGPTEIDLVAYFRFLQGQGLIEWA